MATKARKKNPAAVAGAVLFPQMARDYLFKPWIDRETGETFSTVTVQQDNGTFLCLVADRPVIRFTAKDWISIPKDSSGEVSPGVLRNVLRTLGLREADFKRLK